MASRKAPNLTRLPSGAYRVRVQVRGQTRAATAPTKDAAISLRAKLLAELDTATTGTKRRRPGTRTVTVADLVAMQLDQAGYAATTHADLSAVRDRLPADILERTVVDVDPMDLDRLYHALTGAGWTAHRVQRVHQLLSASFARAVRWGWIRSNPAAAARPPSVERREVRPPSPATVSVATKAIAADVQFAAFIRLAAVTGARRGELCGLQWGDVDLEACTVGIRRAVTYTPASGVTVKDTKTGAKGRRVIPVDTGTVDVLKRLRADEAKRLLKVGLRIGPKSWVFSDRLGTDPWRPDRPTQRWVRLRKVTPELAGVRLHDLRHLVATELLAAGVDLAVVAGRLGHSSPRTTLGVYGHSLPGREREAADIIAARLG